MNNNHSTITNNHAFAERKRYVTAFNSTMVKIWREQIICSAWLTRERCTAPRWRCAWLPTASLRKSRSPNRSTLTVFSWTTAQARIRLAAIRATWATVSSTAANAVGGSHENTSLRWWTFRNFMPTTSADNSATLFHMRWIPIWCVARWRNSVFSLNSDRP